MKRVALLVAVLLLLLCSCKKEERFDAGQKMSGAELVAYRDALYAQNAAQQEALPDSACYFTDSGTVYHYDKKCSHLSASSTVRSGSIAEAIAAGASRPCSRCAKDAE